MRKLMGVAIGVVTSVTAIGIALSSLSSLSGCGGEDSAINNNNANPDGASDPSSSSSSSSSGSIDGGVPGQEETGTPTFFASSLAAGATSACAITKEQGELRCWGANLNAASKVVSPGIAYERVAVGAQNTCALRATDHRLECWTTATLAPLAGDTGSFKEIAAGFNHQCAIATTGALYCWGTNNFGELGMGDTTPRTSLTAIPGGATDWAQVSAALYSTCALKESGALYCWGINTQGQVGNNGTVERQPTPVPIAAGTTWTNVSVGGTASCGVTTDGSLRCWGTLAARNNKVPTVVDTANDWARVSVSQTHACALKKDGRIYCWGSNASGELGNGALTASQGLVQAGTAIDWADVVTGNNFSCGRKKDGAIRCWGSNGQGQLGTNNAFHLTPTKVGAGPDWKYVAAGSGATCAVKKNNELACWGQVPGATLATDPRRQLPSTITSPSASWSPSALAIAGGHACARSATDGAIYCWGYGSRGELGLGKNTSMAAQPQSTGLIATEVATSDEHTCAIAQADSRLHCWGNGIFGKMLNVNDSPVPALAGTDTWRAIATGGSSTCGVRTTGQLFCFGFGYDGTQEQIGTDSDWTSIAVSPTSNSPYFGIRQNGVLATWSYNSDLTQVGIETTWRSIAAGQGHQCAIRTNNTLACMGQNSQGQIGDGTTAPVTQSAMKNVGTSADWETVAVGASHTCGIRNGGELYCWGDNSQGQIGDGSAWSTIPTLVQ